MRISSSQLAQIVAQSLQGAKALDGKLELKVGEIVRATLLDFMGSSTKDALIQIGTAKLRAQLDVPLPLGAKVALLVTGEQRGGALELKVVSGAPQANGQPGALDPGAVLKAVGLTDTDDHKALVREWMSRGLPLKSDTLRAAAELIRQTGNSPSALNTLAHMAERGVPMHRAAFDALHTLETGPKLHDLLGKLSASLQELPNLQVTNKQNQAQPATPSPSIPGQPQPGTHFPENKILRPVPTAGDTHTQARPEPAPLSPATRGQLVQLADAVRLLTSGADLSAESLRSSVKQLGLGLESQLANAIRRLPSDATPAQLLQAFEGVLKQADDAPGLKQLLLQLQAARPELEAAGLRQMADDISLLAKHVTGQQLMQGTGQERSDLFYQYAGVPVQVGGRQQTVELHIMSRKTPGQKELDPANCYILFRLDMPNLGELDIHLHIVDKVVGVRFLTEGDAEIKIEQADLQNLRTALTATGYHLGVLKAEAKQDAATGPNPPLLPPVLTRGGLDFKV